MLVHRIMCRIWNIFIMLLQFYILDIINLSVMQLILLFMLIIYNKVKTQLSAKNPNWEFSYVIKYLYQAIFELSYVVAQ